MIKGKACNALQRVVTIRGLVIVCIALALIGNTGCVSIVKDCMRSSPEKIAIKIPNYCIPASVRSIQRLAVLDFECDESNGGSGVGRSVANAFIAQLSMSGHYRLAERAEIDRIMGELKKAHTNDMVDPMTVRRIGKQFGLDAIVMGCVGTHRVASGIPTVVMVGIQYRVVSVETGEILLAREEKAEAKTYQVTRPGQQMLEEVASKVVEKCAGAILPEAVCDRFIFHGGSDESKTANELGINYAKKELWEDA